MSEPGSITQEPPASVRNHLESLTGLRIFAALAVYFSHLPVPHGAPIWLATLMRSGYAGVTFFFVLSGFVLTINYWDRLRTPSQLWAYGVARVARVYPVYLLVLSWPLVHLFAADALPTGRALEHIFALQAWDGDVNVAYSFVGPAWSISVEFFLYATLPILILVLRRVDRGIPLLLVLMTVVIAIMFAVAAWFDQTGRGGLAWTDPASAHRWLYRMPLTRIGDFLLGIFAARLYVRLRARARAQRLGWLLIVLGLLAAIVLATRQSLLFTTWSWDSIYAVPATCLILGLAMAPANPIGQLLSLRLVVLMGEASYAFYLVHTIVLSTLRAGSWATVMNTSAVLVEAQNLGVTLVLAVGVHVVIERPARMWLRSALVRPTRRPAARRRAPHAARH